MADILDFPENFKGHMTQGKQFFEEGHFSAAKIHFVAALDLEDSLSVNNWLVKTLIALDEYKEAKKISQEKLPDYLAQDDLLADWLIILLHEKKVQAVKRYVLTYAKEAIFKKEYLEKVKVLEDYIQQFEMKKIKETQKKLSEVPKDYQVTDFFELLDLLPTNYYLKEARRILANIIYPLMLRNKLLANLRQLEVTETVTIITLSGTKEVVPKALPLHGTEANYQAIMGELQQITSMLDSTMSKSIIALERQYLWLLYPEVSQIKNPRNWLEVSLRPYKDFLPLQMDWQEEALLSKSQEAALWTKINAQLT